MFFVAVPCQGHYSTKTNHFCNARSLSRRGLTQIFTWKNGNENIPPVPSQALSTWSPARRSHTLHTRWPEGLEREPFPKGEVLFVGVSPSVNTRPWWRNCWRNHCETILHLDFLCSSSFNKHLNKRFNRSRGPVKGFVGSKDSVFRTFCQTCRPAHMTS